MWMRVRGWAGECYVSASASGEILWRLALVARGMGDSGAAMEVTRKGDGRRHGSVTEGDTEV
eukprot:3932098-Pyramimonas_sp.AAC.1